MNPMKINLRSTLLASAAALSLFTPMKAPAQTTTSLQPETWSATITKTYALQYLLYLPKGYDAASGKRWPLMLFLHGSGERGNDVWKVAVHGPPKLVRQGKDFPFILVAPQCPEGQRWQNEPLLKLLDEVIAAHAVDTNRVYLTGLSMGGYGTWSLGLSHPEKFAALVPICGGGNMIDALLSRNGRVLKTLGVWAFHGGKDPVVPLEESERMVNALKRAGCPDVRLTVYPEAQHDSWTEAYNNPELYDWLLKHERGKPAEKE